MLNRLRCWLRPGSISAAAAALGVAPVAADPRPDLQAVAVTLQRMPAQSWAGYGIYLGNGMVITAAHVAAHSVLTQLRLVVADQPYAVESLKEGRFPDNDLAVLRIVPPLPAQLLQRRTDLCTDAPHPGEAVVVATPEKVTSSTVIAPEALPPDLRDKYAASIKDVYTTGNSGSGVFDAGSHCLLGIMSSKIEQQVHLIINGTPAVRTVGLAKYFVPSADIKAFLDGLPQP